MFTDYFEVYRDKVQIDCIQKQINEKQKAVDYNRSATISGGMMAKIIQEYCDKIEQKLEKKRDLVKEKKSKYTIELLAIDDMNKNLPDNFVVAMLAVLQEHGLKLRFDNKQQIDVSKSVKHVTNLIYFYPEEKMAQYVSNLVGSIYIEENGEKVSLLNNFKPNQIVELFKTALNGLYTESLNYVSADHFKDNKSLQGQTGINNISGGYNL